MRFVAEELLAGELPSGKARLVQAWIEIHGDELRVAWELAVNGESRRFDVKPYLGRGIFVRLRDLALFRGVRVIAGSIEWPGGLDLSYDTLYIDGQPNIAPALEVEQGHAPSE